MLSKTQLKNMFLIKLEQYSKPGSGVSYGADTIIPLLNEGKITNGEKELAWEAFEDLKREGLIVPDHSQSSSQVFTKITSKGKRYYDSIKNNIEISLDSCDIELSNLIKDEQLLNACQSDFDTNDEKKYWNAVNNAMRHLEVRIRDKAKLPSHTAGIDVVNEAFNTTSGKRILTCCNSEEEKKGFHLILMGLIKFHRNLKAHHEGRLCREDALKIVAYVDYVLGIVDFASRERNEMDTFF